MIGLFGFSCFWHPPRLSDNKKRRASMVPSKVRGSTHEPTLHPARTSGPIVDTAATTRPLLLLIENVFVMWAAAAAASFFFSFFFFFFLVLLIVVLIYRLHRLHVGARGLVRGFSVETPPKQPCTACSMMKFQCCLVMRHKKKPLLLPSFVVAAVVLSSTWWDFFSSNTSPHTPSHTHSLLV